MMVTDGIGWVINAGVINRIAVVYRVVEELCPTGMLSIYGFPDKDVRILSSCHWLR